MYGRSSSFEKMKVFSVFLVYVSTLDRLKRTSHVLFRRHTYCKNEAIKYECLEGSCNATEGYTGALTQIYTYASLEVRRAM